MSYIVIKREKQGSLKTPDGTQVKRKKAGTETRVARTETEAPEKVVQGETLRRKEKPNRSKLRKPTSVCWFCQY